jgi:hypothetical protein
MLEKHADCEFYDLFLHEPAAVRNDIFQISSSLPSDAWDNALGHNMPWDLFIHA